MSKIKAGMEAHRGKNLHGNSNRPVGDMNSPVSGHDQGSKKIDIEAARNCKCCQGEKHIN